MTAPPAERIPPPDETTWSLEQRAAVQELTSGPRGALFGPFRPLLHSPGLMDRLQKTGEYIRWYAEMDDSLRELVILMVARHWDQEFEWRYHRPLAAAAGLPDETLRALAAERRPTSLDARQLAVWDLIRELLDQRTVTDATVAAAVDAVGHRRVVEYVATAGYYTTLAMVMNVAGTAPPAGDPLPRIDRSRP